MANLPETPQWEDGIYQIEVSDPVLGGPDGISNRQAKQLAKRTSYLKKQVEQGGQNLKNHVAADDPHTQYAKKNSPVLTGEPTAPTPPKSDNSKKLATTAHVKAALADYAPLNSPTLTGEPTAPTPPKTDNSKRLSTTAHVKATLADYAPLNSPVLTGSPTTPTPPALARGRELVNAEFVAAKIATLIGSAPGVMDTLQEIAAALNNNPNFANEIIRQLAAKQPLNTTLTALSGKSVAQLLEYLGLRGTVDQAAGALQKAQNGADIPNKSKFIDNTGLRDTVNKANNAVPTSRKINNKVLSSDISLTASDVSAFALGRTGAMASNDKAVPWNAPSGIYLANIGGATCMILHFNMNTGSCPSVQFKINYKNGGVAYRSARDGHGFESDWVELMPATKTVQDIRLSTKEGVWLWNGPGYKDQPPYVITGVANNNSDEVPDQIYRRALQKFINGTWYNVGGL